MSLEEKQGKERIRPMLHLETQKLHLSLSEKLIEMIVLLIDSKQNNSDLDTGSQKN